MRKQSPYTLASVDNALLLIHALRDQGTLTVTEAAEMLKVAPSSAHRLLTTLTQRDFAMQDVRHVYHAGPALGLPPGRGHLLTTLRREALPQMESLSERVGETVNLAVRIGAHVRFVANVESTRLVRVGDQEGTVLPAHLTSGGQAILAASTDDELRRQYRVDGPVSERPLQLTDGAWRHLAASLRRVRVQGYAVNRGAAEPDVYAVGMVVRHGSGPALAAMSIAMPRSRFRPSTTGMLAHELALTIAALPTEGARQVGQTAPPG